MEEQKFSDWEAYVNRNPELKKAVEIMTKLDATSPNARSYVVGGAVRDIIMGNDFDDVDIATNVPLNKIEELFPSHDIGKNKQFGIVVVEYQGSNFEIANFRQDGKYSDGRRPDTVEIVADFQGDASRRDFTINAMAIDKEGNILDYFDGKGDIKNKVIRTVGDPEKRFGEDYIRMLRAIRFGSRFGYKIDPETLKAIKSNSAKIQKIAVERIMKEVIGMAKQSGSKFADAILMMKEYGLLQYILPEVVKMDEFEHSVEHHPEGNVLQHTLAALRSSNSTDPVINLSILFHDIGKIVTHSINDKGKHQYLEHANKAVYLIKDIAERLKIDNDTRESMVFSALHHMQIHDFLKMRDSVIAKILGDPNWDVLMAVAEADARARGSLFDQEEWDKIIAKVDRLREKFKSRDAIMAIKKIINGKWIMQVRPDVKPSKELGDLIDATVEWILDNDVDINDLESIADFVKNYK